MQEGHSHPGVAYFQSHVYVFSGRTFTCERLSLFSTKWSPIVYFPEKGCRIVTYCDANQVYLIYTYNLTKGYFETVKYSSRPSELSACVIDSELVLCTDYKYPLCEGGIKTEKVTTDEMIRVYKSWTVTGENGEFPRECWGSFVGEETIFPIWKETS